MEQALYDPQYGFYSRGPAIGAEHGPFHTNARYLLFAQAIAQAVERAESHLGESLRIVEFGGGTGELGAHVLSFLSKPHEYVIVERSEGFRRSQQRRGLHAVADVAELQAAPSFIFANEVLDAFPVHRVVGGADHTIEELYVALDNHGEFIEVLGPLSTARLAERLARERVSLGRGQIAEVNLELEPFLSAVKSILPHGYFVCIDYGDSAAQLYHYTCRNGTLRCYHQQRRVHDPFDRIGEQDLTADVDFTALSFSAQKVGLVSAGRAFQGEWLQALLPTTTLDSFSQLHPDEDPHHLISPARLGSAFQVLAFKTPLLPQAPGFVE
ncbi:MAG: hypothetical protein D6704_09270 [Nitrospirae bacterium]|nr:MAG: hypothetical protein D6704_09270 [Nitrospirota bacterium]